MISTVHPLFLLQTQSAPPFLRTLWQILAGIPWKKLGALPCPLISGWNDLLKILEGNQSEADLQLWVSGSWSPQSSGLPAFPFCSMEQGGKNALYMYVTLHI